MHEFRLLKDNKKLITVKLKLKYKKAKYQYQSNDY